MKNFRFLVSVSIIAFTFQAAAMAADYPPREKEAIQPVTIKQAEEEAALPKENVTPESALTNKIGATALAEIKVTVLSGNNLHGEKSYKVDYKVIEIQGSATEKKDPAVIVSFKNKKEKGLYAVESVSVMEKGINAYKISAKIIEVKPGDEPTVPKITYLD